MTANPEAVPDDVREALDALVYFAKGGTTKYAEQHAATIQQHIAALSEQLAAAEKDARRYRWIAANATVETEHWCYWHDEPECVHLSERVDIDIAHQEPTK
jgi:predicted chitinase